ncbi:type IV pilin N-terminal domain-containing protein [Methanosarcina hadiensis]|uniref:type IV pilin N-terminal domain-containing protein n=1 Tax=Methanosarcina hadiensis TaxID=3078083 RepID=UPI003977CC13
MLRTPGTGKGLKKEAAVSEVMGVVLLTGIVVIMLSTLGVYVFSMEGPDDVPHTNVQEIMDISTDTIYLKNNGGEPVSTENLRIIVNVNGKKYEYNSTQIYENLEYSNVWKMGDTIEINTKDTWGVNLNNNDKVELFLVDTPSNELIQKSTLTSEPQKNSDLNLCFIPMGDITDTSASGKDSSKKGYGDKKQVHFIDADDEKLKEKTNEKRNCTTYYPPTNVINTSIYQEFEFKIKPSACGLRPRDTLGNATLIIVYYTHDSSGKDSKGVAIKLKYYDTLENGRGEWVYSDTVLPAHNTNFEPELINLTDRINTPADLANFKVRIEASTEANENAEKEINIDYIGLQVEEASAANE